ncbi:hypothetical protein [Pseudomonas aeruginosa]|uniref:hypothetical protein n=1 Tax=Pseudomonas aeruginosa TaxID=287 RepID=UPI0009A981C1|nr:hypothetical protein [Pseudomonas aeruginosa]MBX5820786.1 hypothetical protein [Pseudomonas aeruginosa]MBX5827119.1 hypothetical protein [Pseudomonas aeruginosa]MBX5833406.1 hypothetical protein [Pseudomonas aeruginosa]MBX5845259.1 hypothetical protein [Pseudomonas aeruginosa]MBX5883413.1 hypothetical protein [Pseudomonas aeruginosa]
MADTLTTRKLLGQLLVGVLIVIGLAVVGTLLSLFALNHFGGICSGQPIPDSGLSFSSATAGGNPSLN